MILSLDTIGGTAFMYSLSMLISMAISVFLMFDRNIGNYFDEYINKEKRQTPLKTKLDWSSYN